MALAALPTELLDAVLAPLTPHPQALAAAALSCSALNPSATRLLYRHLSLSAYARNLSVVNLLALRPDLAGLVRTFSVHLDDAEPAVLPTWILSPPQGKKSQKSDILRPVLPFYPRLEHLTCNFPLDAHLATFLGQVPSLISLQLASLLSNTDADVQSEPEHVFVPSSHIPLLEAYTGPAHILPALASRPLRAVHLSGDLTLDLLPSPGAPLADDDPSRLRQSGASPHHIAQAPTSSDNTGALLQVMSAMTSAAPAQLLESLALAYPNLVCLRLMTTRALWDLPDLAFYSRIAATLSTLPHLAAFELSGIHWQSRRKSPSPSEPSSSSSAVTSASAAATEKEWISPPVSPRAAQLPPPDEEEDDLEDRDYDFDGAFLDWSY
ncbi:hypothetical protein ONZ51_g4164 [Trametes cubensis]|uniref:Uncharacterized protein n=1 Tax=Trametes cubensis TaxID=1111947 RepID=A0AAD7XD92_9APHY|nr:hypothetical protein ONZ51_g4164 [Trametes cubensis]